MLSENMKSAWVSVMVASFTYCSVSLAEPSAVDMKPELAKTVGQMLMIDAAIAHKFEEDRMLAAMGKKNVTTPSSPPPQIIKPLQSSEVVPVVANADAAKKEEVAKETPLILLGIFGVNENLYVDIQIDNERVRYQRGHSNPIAGNLKSKYQLVSVKAPCIELMKDASKTLVCLEKDAI